MKLRDIVEYAILAALVVVVIYFAVHAWQDWLSVPWDACCLQ